MTNATEDVRVVVVDDHADTRETIKTLLELDGYNVRTASGGKEALAVIEAHRPACVLLDLGLPDLSGIDVAQRLRMLHDAGTVIIVLTGSSRPEEHLAAEKAGADYVMQKPVNVEVLRRMLPRIE